MQGVAITTSMSHNRFMLKYKMKGVNMNNVIDSLMLSSLKHNYIEFVEEWGYEEANNRLHGLFGETWLNNREQVVF